MAETTNSSQSGKASQSEALDRLSIRQRPDGRPIMHQRWEKLLFLHWPIPPEQLRPLIPQGLEIDTWEGTAWVGVTPLTIGGIRPVLGPALPLISSSHEINVRTYVHRDGVPGVWFLSLDASNAMAVWAARLTFFLPYYRAAMGLQTDGETIHFRSRRTHRGAAPAEFQASWRRGNAVTAAAPQTRDFFLIERYCLYSARGGRLFRARIHHEPWPLCTAEVEHLASSMLQAHGLPAPEQAPLVHAQAAPLPVRVWPPERLT